MPSDDVGHITKKRKSTAVDVAKHLQSKWREPHIRASVDDNASDIVSNVHVPASECAETVAVPFRGADSLVDVRVNMSQAHVASDEVHPDRKRLFDSLRFMPHPLLSERHIADSNIASVIYVCYRD